MTLPGQPDVVRQIRLAPATTPANDGPPLVDCLVVVVTYNSARDISALIESLPSAANGLGLRIVVVDNGSTDNTVQVVQRFTHVTCVDTQSNLGYAAGINLGLRLGGPSRALLVLNPDVVLAPRSLTHLWDALQQPGTGIAVPMIVDQGGNTYPSLRREPTVLRALGDGLLGAKLSRRPGWLSEMVSDPKVYTREGVTDWATGAVWLVSRECSEAVGTWDESFFLYSEETDYAHRARDAGYRIRYVPAARAYHRGGASAQGSALAALSAVNRIRCFRKSHGRSLSLFFWLTVLVGEALRAARPGNRMALTWLWSVSTWHRCPALVRSAVDRSAGSSGHAHLAEPCERSGSSLGARVAPTGVSDKTLGEGYDGSARAAAHITKDSQS